MEATIVFPTRKGNAATDTRKVAAKFGKRHSHVLRDVRTILAHRAEHQALGGEPKIGLASEGAIFHPGHYTDSQGKQHDMYLLNRAAFTLLVLGFTGKKAAAFKEEYVREFDRMETELRSFQNDGPQINLLEHVCRDAQVANSKSINNHQYLLGGVGGVIAYNRANCQLHTGRRPSELLKDAKARGVRARKRTSAKELLRHEAPETACAMSLADQLVRGGATLEEAAAVSVQAKQVFAGMMKLGFRPSQLSQ